MYGSEYIRDLFQYFRNKVLTGMGAERDFLRLLDDGDVTAAIGMMEDREEDVDNAIREYNPQTHGIMKRPNKRTSKDFYETCKLPRARQRYINEVELFFLLGKPVRWKREEGSDAAFSLFSDFVRESRFDALMREAKRLAGAETESAKVYHLYREGDVPRIRALVISRSKGYRLRPLFDEYGNLMAFAWGYTTRRGGRTTEHWDVQTKDLMYRCVRRNLSWEVGKYPNPTGKLNVIYYRQRKAWEGLERRLEREEELDSKVGDANNYFADPIAAASADVINSMVDPAKPGKLIQLTGSSSKFEYINPPSSSSTRDAEKAELEKSILFDSFTPNLDFEHMRGLGSLSGVAVRNAMILGFIKADNYKEIYEDLVDRDKNVIIGILKFLHPDMEEELSALRVSFSFSSPFEDDRQEMWSSITALRSAGLISLERAVEMLGLTGAPEQEVEKIRAEAAAMEAQ